MSGGIDLGRVTAMVRGMNLLSQPSRPPADDIRPVAATVDHVVAHRLQVGLAGLAAMILLAGVADMIMTRARQSDDAAVPQAAATVEPVPTGAAGNNTALETAGVVPDLPRNVADEPVPAGPVLPEQGSAAGPAGQ